MDIQYRRELSKSNRFIHSWFIYSSINSFILHSLLDGIYMFPLYWCQDDRSTLQITGVTDGYPWFLTFLGRLIPFIE